jgi:hypothetical protein
VFKQLTETEAQEYRQWARDNYVPFSEISGVWHPVVQAECVRINASVAAVPLRCEQGDDT